MNTLRTVILILLSVSFFFGPISGVGPGFSAQMVDNSLYAELPDKYAKVGIVDYRGFKDEESSLDKYLGILGKIYTSSLSRDKQYVFYINTCNACTIKLILSRYPGIESIKQLGNIFKSPWQNKIYFIDGDLITLDEIEHQIIRPRFKDPRAHFEVNCASKGCSLLRSKPYKGNILSEQPDDSTRRFINHPQSYRFENNVLYINEIFRWFSEDFDEDVTGFYFKYAEGDLRERLVSHRENIKIRYYDYD